jgi:predicted pyridoxine 5'-phosphate oxidase superfamily flavin-nucleotide-binding protein
MAARGCADLDWSPLGLLATVDADLPTGVEAAAAPGGFDWKTQFTIIYRV